LSRPDEQVQFTDEEEVENMLRLAKRHIDFAQECLDASSNDVG
jgi:hypothetical protein